MWDTEQIVGGSLSPAAYPRKYGFMTSENDASPDSRSRNDLSI